MNEKSLAIGSTLAAFLASLCCLGPLVLGGVGFGAALVATFAPLRPYFLTLSGLLLALGFYLVYRRPKPVPACEGETCAPESPTSRMVKPLLWLATLAVAALAFFPSYGGKLVRATPSSAPSVNSAQATAELKIDGMTCEACAAVIQRELMKTAGVTLAEVQYPAGRATVQYDPAKSDAARLIEAVQAAGYKASLLGSGQ